MNRELWLAQALIAVLALVTAPASGQSRPVQDDPQDQPPIVQQSQVRPQQTGRTADSSVGRVGQRQTREQAAPNAQPLARINSRIANRVQNRIRNRIDRNYDPEAGTTSPFATAEDQARNTRPNR